MDAELDVLDLGLRAYGPVLELQERLVAERKAGHRRDTLILVEHEPVYTLGRGAKDSHVVASRQDLAARGIEVVRTGRGGDVTYHGPGQLVGYPIIDLGARSKGAAWYVAGLEEALIRTLAAFDIVGRTDPRNRGVWVGDAKIAAIGVRITGRVTMHGFSLNVATNMAHYAGIIPCGIADRGVTSMHLLIPAPDMERVKLQVTGRFQDVFGYARLAQGQTLLPV
jgi:lipoyl(octanoyl) transferase